MAGTTVVDSFALVINHITADQREALSRRLNSLAPGLSAAEIALISAQAESALLEHAHLKLNRLLLLELHAAVRSGTITATGALPLAATDNLNFGNPERPEIMGQLVFAI